LPGIRTTADLFGRPAIICRRALRNSPAMRGLATSSAYSASNDWPRSIACSRSAGSSALQ